MSLRLEIQQNINYTLMELVEHIFPINLLHQRRAVILQQTVIFSLKFHKKYLEKAQWRNNNFELWLCQEIQLRVSLNISNCLFWTTDKYFLYNFDVNETFIAIIRIVAIHAKSPTCSF